MRTHAAGGRRSGCDLPASSPPPPPGCAVGRRGGRAVRRRRAGVAGRGCVPARLGSVGRPSPPGTAPAAGPAGRAGTGCSAAERDLLLLAGLAQEHEGLSGTLRSMHPQASAHPTVGLAALVLDRRGHQRVELRRLLTEGRAVRAGLLRLDGGEALFERSILLADGLWEALHGLDAFPAGLDRVPSRPAPGGLAGWLAEPRWAGRSGRCATAPPVTLLVQAGDEAVALGRCAALAEAAGARLLAARPGRTTRRRSACSAAHAAVRDAVPVLVALRRPTAPDRRSWRCRHAARPAAGDRPGRSGAALPGRPSGAGGAGRRALHGGPPAGLAGRAAGAVRTGRGRAGRPAPARPGLDRPGRAGRPGRPAAPPDPVGDRRA